MDRCADFPPQLWCNRHACEWAKCLKAQREEAAAEVERLKKWGQDGYAEAMKHNSQAARLETRLYELKEWAREGRDDAGRRMDSLTEVGPHSFWRGKWDLFTKLISRLSEDEEGRSRYELLLHEVCGTKAFLERVVQAKIAPFSEEAAALLEYMHTGASEPQAKGAPRGA